MWVGHSFKRYHIFSCERFGDQQSVSATSRRHQGEPYLKQFSSITILLAQALEYSPLRNARIRVVQSGHIL